MLDIKEILKKTVEIKASDLHITVGLPPMMRINGELRPFGEEILSQEDTERMAKQLLNEEQVQTLEKNGEVDLSYVIPGVSRFRVNVYKQRSSYSAAIRVIWIKIPSID